MTTLVKISRKLRRLHPRSRIAGKTLPVTVQDGYQLLRDKFLATFGERTDLVPVRLGSMTYYVEPEYIEEYQDESESKLRPALLHGRARAT